MTDTEEKGCPAFRWRILGEIAVTKTFPGPTPDEVFDEFLDTLLDQKIPLIFSFTVGTAELKATQRKRAAEVLKQGNIAAIVLTDNRFTRGILTAVSWLGAKVKGFSWHEVDKAIKAASEVTFILPPTKVKLREIAEEFRIEHAGSLDY